MMTKLRWWSQQRQNVTAEQVAAERLRTGEPMMVCKARLTSATKPALQYWSFSEGWKDVPFVVEVMPNNVEYSNERSA